MFEWKIHSWYEFAIRQLLYNSRAEFQKKGGIVQPKRRGLDGAIWWCFFLKRLPKCFHMFYFGTEVLVGNSKDMPIRFDLHCFILNHHEGAKRFIKIDQVRA